MTKQDLVTAAVTFALVNGFIISFGIGYSNNPQVPLFFILLDIGLLMIALVLRQQIRKEGKK